MEENKRKPPVHMAGIKEVAELFNLPEYYVRQVVKRGLVKCVRVSPSSRAKFLINVQSFTDYLENGNEVAEMLEREENVVEDTSVIRPIPLNL